MEVFLDSSTIILGLEFSKSNSAEILNLILNKKIYGVINEKVIEEVRKYFKNRRGRNYAFLVEVILKKNFSIVKKEEILNEIDKWKEKVKKKDIEHIATVKRFDIKHKI